MTTGGTGAWIAKNSFGAAWGENGYFYISYNDTKILSENASFPWECKVPRKSSSVLYYYDDLGWVQSWGYESQEAYGLMKFVATNDNGLAKIGTWMVAASSSLNIEIYDNFDGTTLSSLLVTLNGQQFTYPGYYSLNVPYEGFNLVPGNDYYIKVKYTTPGCNNPIPAEMVSPNYSTGATIQTGKCWMSGDGITWDAVGGGTPYMLDLCIKAYTYKSLEPPSSIQISVLTPPLQHVQLYFYAPIDRAGLTGYNVYRDNMLLNPTPLPPNSMYYDDYNVPFCEHVYTMTGIYGSSESVPSEPRAITIGQQTILRESFEQWYYASYGWKIENIVNPTGMTLISYVHYDDCPLVAYAFDSTYCVKFASCVAGQNEQARLKRDIPISTVGLNNISLQFVWYESSLANWATDGVEVQWSTNGTTWTTAASFPRYNAQDGWRQKTVNLPPGAAGQPTLYFAFLFHADSDGAADCLLDLVEISGCGPPLPGYLIIGNNGGVSTTYPYSTGNMDARTQIIYHQSEILWAGGYPGMITQIGFNIPESAPSPQVMHNFQVKLKNTTQTSLTNWVSDGMTTVYSGDFQVGYGMGWDMITLQTPFYYDLTNLLVEICFDNDSYSRDTYALAGCCYSIYHHRFDGLSSSGCNTTGGSAYSNQPWFRMYMIPVVQTNNSLQNITTTANQSNCFDATQTITVAGSGTIFKVKNAGNVNLIAGQNIQFYPGASVEPGGYLHGYISTNGQYCSSLKNSLVETPEDANQGTPKEPEIAVTQFFRIFPNPTSDSFTLEVNKIDPGKPVFVEVYSIMGEKILTRTLAETSKNEFSLSGKSAGIYLVKLVSAGISEVQKVVKQ